MLHSRRRTLREQRMLGEGERELFVEGRAPCVIALHGFGGTVAELRPLLDRIGRAGFAIDAALLPGHGTRVENLQDATFDGWVDAVRARTHAALAAHGRIVLLGFSLGSLVAMRLASERPAGLAGLVVLGNALTLRLPMSLPMALWARLGWPMPDLYLVKPRAGDVLDTSALRALVTYDRHPLRAAMEVWRAGARVRTVVGRIACPALVLHGRHDVVCSWRNATCLAKRIGSTDVSVRIFENSAHVLACDAEREEVACEVSAFIERITRG
jgi:carboxylesterase